MAKEEDAEQTETSAKKGKGKLFLIIGIVVFLLAGIGVGSFVMLKGKSSDAAEEGTDAAAEGEEGEGEGGSHDGAVAMLPLETFIVNLQVKGSFLKVAVQLEFFTAEVPPTIEHDTPKIRDAFIRVMSSKTAPDILSLEGKEKLREELKQAANEVLQSEDVAQVYFTEFIIQ